MTRIDLLYLALIGTLLTLDAFVLWPGFLRRASAEPGRARLWLWSGWMTMLWTLVAAGVALWLYDARAWDALRLASPHGWRLWVAIGLVMALTAHFGSTALKIARARRQKRIQLGNADVGRLLPHTRTEFVWWVAVSLTAGICEEFIFRGYLIWVFQPLLGLWGAAALAVVWFALAHAYQGAKGIVATGVVGAMLTLVVLLFGSLVPAMALHAVVDIGQGLVGWLALREVPGAPVAETP